MTVLLPLGAVWALCTLLTESLLASTLIHAGADLIIVNGLLEQGQTPAASAGL